ncbi:hypothetical protein QAD02_002967 [Eretmocerus hayati]|uniref:Uncharacterized protein n=1 Tax=Eretmocerus hayati TaxID=131215 RepID=A0ACC2NKI1_9HYME|nr:hypothetical protein QAD02_002967 [Eretmocerus hayati]
MVNKKSWGDLSRQQQHNRAVRWMQTVEDEGADASSRERWDCILQEIDRERRIRNTNHDQAYAGHPVKEIPAQSSTQSSSTTSNPAISNCSNTGSPVGIAADVLISPPNNGQNSIAQLGLNIDSQELPTHLQEPLPPPESTLADELGEWADHRVPHGKVKELLELLRKRGLDVSSSVETLKKNGRLEYLIRKCSSGEYLHYGLHKCLEDEIIKYGIKKGVKLKFDVHVDGVHLGGKRYLWPILGRLVIPDQETAPFVIGVYHGSGKPKSAKLYLQEFVKEYKRLNKQGFVFNEEHYICSLRLVIADDPARAFIKQMQQHNGTHGCDKCFIKGKQLQRRMCFHRYCKLRTNLNFRLREQRGHHLTLKKTILEQLSIDMILQFSLDPMHLVYLGVVRTLWSLLVELNNDPDTDFEINVAQFNAALEELEEWIPIEFSKKRVKSLSNLSDWKATHSRFFLLYASIPLVHRFLPVKYAKLAYMLTCGIRILSDRHRDLSYNFEANKLLRSFVEEFITMFGSDKPTYNIHGLGHLATEAELHGPLDSFSASIYENFMRILKGFIKKPEKPLQQIFRNLKHQSRFVKLKKSETYPVYEESNNQSGTLPSKDFSNRFDKAIYSDFELTTEPSNNICIMEDGTVVKIECSAFRDLTAVVIGKQFTVLEDIPHYPIPSTELDISIASGLSDEIRYWPLTSMCYKAVILHSDGHNYVIPFLH